MKKELIKAFQNDKFGNVRVVLIGTNQQPYFVGKDVAEALGYRDTADAIKKHVDEEDKLTRQFADSGQNRNMICINESGLYSLILSSKLPSAKEFKRWVTSEVLPSIRQTGSYSTEQHNPYGNLSKELQAIFVIDHKQQEMDIRITKLENTMTIDYGQQNDIQALVSKKVISVLGGTDAPAYKNKTVSSKAFKEIYRWLKRKFEVNSYKNIAVKDFERAKEIIPQWELSEELQLMIKGSNSQMRLGQ
ncbi:MAG: ORF6C domain-containing protein [Candidatus Niameybacter stercoravium]|nr:ORF6C domain-containing protein [Candidatus Niameybacter stercoravium]